MCRIRQCSLISRSLLSESPIDHLAFVSSPRFRFSLSGALSLLGCAPGGVSEPRESPRRSDDRNPRHGTGKEWNSNWRQTAKSRSCGSFRTRNITIFAHSCRNYTCVEMHEPGSCVCVGASQGARTCFLADTHPGRVWRSFRCEITRGLDQVAKTSCRRPSAAHRQTWCVVVDTAAQGPNPKLYDGVFVGMVVPTAVWRGRGCFFVILPMTCPVYHACLSLWLKPPYIRACRACIARLTTLTSQRFLRRDRGTYGPEIKAGETRTWWRCTYRSDRLCKK